MDEEQISDLVKKLLQKELDTFRKEMTDLRAENQKLRATITELQNDLDKQNQYSRKDCLVLSGNLTEPTDDENIRQIVCDAVKDHLDIDLPQERITACHRLQNKDRIVVRFMYREDRDEVYTAKIAQKKHGLFVQESLTPRRAEFVQRLVKMKTDGKIANFYTRNGDIFARKTPNNRYIKLDKDLTEKHIMDKLQSAPKRNNTDSTVGHNWSSVNRRNTRSVTAAAAGGGAGGGGSMPVNGPSSRSQQPPPPMSGPGGRSTWPTPFWYLPDPFPTYPYS